MVQISFFKTHSFYGLGHIAFAFLPELKRLGCQYIGGIDNDEIEERNLIPYVVAKKGLRRDSSYRNVYKLTGNIGRYKDKVFGQRCFEYGIHSYTKEYDFRHFPESPEWFPFTVNNWLTSDSWEARLWSLQSIERIVKKDIQQGNVLFENCIPQITRFFIVGVDPLNMGVMSSMSVKHHDYEDPTEFLNDGLLPQIEQQKSMIQRYVDKDPGGLTCAVHNHPLLTIASVYETTKLLYEKSEKEGNFMRQIQVEIREE